MAFQGSQPNINSLKLTPASADPASPVAGQLQYADGTARAAGLWVYSGSAWVRASEALIAARATTAAGQVVGTSNTDIIYGTESFDTANAYNTGTGVFTVPTGAAGKYVVEAIWTSTSSLTLTTGQAVQIILAVNGATRKAAFTLGNGNNQFYGIQIFDIVDAAAGDTIKIQGTSSVSTTLATNAVYNVLNIYKLKD
jgi:hypothetical protein